MIFKPNKLAGAMSGALIGAGLAMLTSNACAEENAKPLVEVDLELVLAADRSASMSRLMLLKQRSGFAAAFRDENLHEIIKSGPLGRIAVVYFEWSDQANQSVVIPWTMIEAIEDMTRFANALEDLELGRTDGETSISGAMYFAQQLLDENRFEAYRKVVDISGNGHNSDGPSLEQAREVLSDRGTTVNGLVLPANDYEAVDSLLKEYFWKEVITGPSSFAINVEPERGFIKAIIRKLALEIAWNG